MNSYTVGPIFAVTIAALIACRGLIHVRPSLGRNLFLRVALNLSLAALAVEVAMVAVFVFAMLMLPDMSEF